MANIPLWTPTSISTTYVGRTGVFLAAAEFVHPQSAHQRD